MRILTAVPARAIQWSKPAYFGAALVLVVALLAAGYARSGGTLSSRSFDRAGVAEPMPARASVASPEAPETLGAADNAGAKMTGPASASSVAQRNSGLAANASSAPSDPQQIFPPLSAGALDRMVVKTGALSLQLGEASSGDALAAAMQRLNSVIASIPGAYVAASSTSYRAETPGVTSAGLSGASAPRDVLPPKPIGLPGPATMATVTLKVPVDSFDQAMLRLRDLGAPLSEQISTQEVTEEYVDLEAQVRNLEATEQQYLRFLERAQRIEEILPIQQRLTDVRGQVERLRGRMTLLQRRSDISTITVSLIVPAGKGSGSDVEGRAIRTLREAWGHLAVVLLGALDVLIYLAVYALPLAPIVAAVVWWRRRQPRTGAPGAPVAAAPGGVV